MMRISIRHNSECVVEFNQIQLSGRKALGGYAISFILKGTAGLHIKETNVSNIGLSLSSSKSSMPLVVSAPSSTQTHTYRYPGQNEQLHFEIILSPGQMVAIEEYRQDQDLELQIDLRAITQLNDSFWSSFETSALKISRQEWLSTLNHARYKNTLLFEIPLPHVETDAEKIIRKAQDLIEHGHYKDAVTQCRQLIELVENHRRDQSQAKNAIKRWKDGEKESLSVIERMHCLREFIKTICHLGPHVGDDFTRSQARAVLGATLSLLAEPTVGAFSHDDSFS